MSAQRRQEINQMRQKTQTILERAKDLSRQLLPEINVVA